MSSQEATATPPPPTQPVRRLTRRRDHKVIAGVCTGLGDYTGLDPIIFRIAFIALAIMGGSGLLLYGLAWLIIPEGGTATSHAHDVFGRFGTTPWLGVALVIVGGAVLLSQAGLWRPPVVWGAALLILGILLFREHESRPEREPLPSKPYPSTAVVPADATTAIQQPGTVAAPRPPRERSALGWYTVAAVLLTLGAAALLDAANAVHITLVRYLALPLAVIGAGLIVGAWRGRSRLLVFLGLLLIPFVLVASLVHVPLTGGAGRFLYQPQSAAELRSNYHIAAGQMTLDLRQVALGSGTTDLTASVGAGEVRVFVPRHTSLNIDGRAGIGGVYIFGREHAGTGVHVQTTAGSSSSAPQLALHLQAGLGDIKIERSSGPITSFPKPYLPSFTPQTFPRIAAPRFHAFSAPNFPRFTSPTLPALAP
jgi:phage shock protein PspC (stress-responsive transcriptional regulator)